MKWIVKELINEYVIVDEDQPHASPVAIGMTEETAILICRAHNSHKRLLKACKRALWAFNTGDTLGGPGLYVTITKLEQAIAKEEDK